jgi:multisubunit Na+/H+ antiporter MnhB subunit
MMQSRFFHALVYLLAFVLFLTLSFVLLTLESFEPLIQKEVAAEMFHSGVTHEVTAILLNFRALDTLLEVAVILLALIAIYTLAPHFRYLPETFESTITNTFVSLLFPFIVICAFYIFYSGSYQSGGAFGAAALLAGGIIILRLVKPCYPLELHEVLLRFVYGSGLLYFVSVGIATLFFGSFLEYKGAVATFFILSIEMLLTLSLAAILATYFINAIEKLKA